jgi:hypothetical protein
LSTENTTMSVARSCLVVVTLTTPPQVASARSTAPSSSCFRSGRLGLVR